MRIAIVTETITQYGGENVIAKELATLFPQAQLYCLFITPSAKKNYTKNPIHTSPFQLLVKHDHPTKYISVIKFISWIYWELVDLSSYDIIISVSGSYGSKNIRKTGNAKHYSYVLTPPKYLYDEYSEINFIKLFPFSLLPLKIIDQICSGRPHKLIAISNEVQTRISQHYHRDSIVIYPPVKLGKFDNTQKEDYFIAFSRLVKQKGIDLAVRTCTKYNLPLLVVGSGPELQYLIKIAGPSIKFRTKCNELQKWYILKKARALIYTSKNEDFGIVPVEAMSVGTPVIGFASGGVLETVIDKKTGILFKEFTPNSLFNAVRKLDRLKIDQQSCVNQAKKFSHIIFRTKFLKLINNV